MKILYLGTRDKLEPNYTYLYYGDLYRSLCKKATVIVQESLSEPVPEGIDAVVFGTSYENDKRDCNLDIDINIPKIYILHKPQMDNFKFKIALCKKADVDLLAYSQTNHAEFANVVGIPSMQLWFAGDPALYSRNDVEKLYDFGFSGALHGGDKIQGVAQDLRNKVHAIAKSLPIKLFWNGSDSVAPRIVSAEEYALRINQTKIWLSTTGPIDDVGVRHFEICLSSALLFCNNMPFQNGDVFVDEQNCIMFENDLSDLEEKLIYYVHHDDEREQIVRRSSDAFLQQHTWDNRADELIKTIHKIQGEKHA